jgi:DNA-binding transcriptional ArsR family regulator
MTTRAAAARKTTTVVDSRDPAVEVLKALSDPIRLGIMSRIASTEELPCTTLEQELPISKSTISYHMRILRAAGLIDIRKQGKFYHYTARSTEIDDVIPGLMSWLVKRSGA